MYYCRTHSLLVLSSQCAVTRVLRINTGNRAAALKSACWVTVTRADPVAADPASVWAVMESLARVSEIQH